MTNNPSEAIRALHARAALHAAAIAYQTALEAGLKVRNAELYATREYDSTLKALKRAREELLEKDVVT